MPTESVRLIAVTFALLPCLLPAQITLDKSVPDAAVSGALADALRLRGDVVATIISGTATPDSAIGRLKGNHSPSGLKIDREADFAVAALDVGRRLLGARKPVEAETFFRTAEASLSLIIARTPDSAARDKAQYLEIRSIIRTSYLNKLAEGKADLQDAVKLVPGDQRLQQMHRLLPADPASTLSNHKALPPRS